MAESVETAVNLANGLMFVEYEDETLPKKFRKTENLIFSTKFACPESGFTIEEMNQDFFLLIVLMVPVRNVRVLVLN